MDFGDGLSHTAFKEAIAEAQTRQTAYNSLLAQADEARNAFGAAEASVRPFQNRGSPVA